MKEVFTHLPIPKNSLGFLPRLGRIYLFLFTSFLVRAREWAVSRITKDDSGQPSSAFQWQSHRCG